MKIKKGFAKRSIAGANIVVPVGRQTRDFNGMITLNDTGSFLWDCLEKETTLDALVAKILGEYDVDEKKAREDAEAFTKLLEENGILE
jgi:hypothetical protein